MMNNIIRFRASSVYSLMVNPKTKAEREAGELSQTAKSYVQECWLRNEYDYDEPVVTPEMMKGHLCEQDAIAVISNQIKAKDFRIKNRETLVNDYFTGTPDIVLKSDGIVEDMKCSWTLKQFASAEISKAYYTQAQVYMDLTGLKKFRLIYVLVNTPEVLVTNEKLRFYYKFNCDEENPHYIECIEKIMRMHSVSHISEEKRIKCFSFEYEEKYIAELKKRVEKAREYYGSLSL